MSHPGLGTIHRPDDKGEDRGKNDRRNKIPGHAIGEFLHWSAAALRFADHAHDLREKRFASNTFGAHYESSGAIHSSANHFGAA